MSDTFLDFRLVHLFILTHNDLIVILGKSLTQLLSLQSCSTLCHPMDCSPPGFSCSQDSPSKNTGVGCHFLFQGIFLTQGFNLSFSCVFCIYRWILCHYHCFYYCITDYYTRKFETTAMDYFVVLYIRTTDTTWLSSLFKFPQAGIKVSDV